MTRGEQRGSASPLCCLCSLASRHEREREHRMKKSLLMNISVGCSNKVQLIMYAMSDCFGEPSAIHFDVLAADVLRFVEEEQDGANHVFEGGGSVAGEFGGELVRVLDDVG